MDGFWISNLVTLEQYGHWPNVWMHSTPCQWAAYVFICIHNIHSPYDQHHHTSVSPLSSPFQTMPREWAKLKTVTKSLDMSQVKSKHRRWARSPAWKLWSPPSYGMQSGSINGSVTYLHSLCTTSIWQTPSTSSSLPLFLSSTNCSKVSSWELIQHQKCVMSQKGGMEGFGSNNFMFKDTCLIMKYNHVLIIVQSTY